MYCLVNQFSDLTHDFSRISATVGISTINWQKSENDRGMGVAKMCAATDAGSLQAKVYDIGLIWTCSTTTGQAPVNTKSTYIVGNSARHRREIDNASVKGGFGF